MDDIFQQRDDNIIARIGSDAMRALQTSGSVQKICSSSTYWISLSRLYVVMVRTGDIPGLPRLPVERKQRYWTEVSRWTVGRPQWVKVSMCQAVYLYEVLKDGEVN